MLYLIATPIGNLGDITIRAIETLGKIDYLLCEDTRVTQNLLNLLKIKNHPELISFYDEIEAQKIPIVIKLLKENREVGLVTDAGTPLISDPGYLLVQKCQKLGISYTALPGANAVLNALILSGLPSARFLFLGFLPKKSGERIKLLEASRNLPVTKIIYESPFRVANAITDIQKVYGPDVSIKVIREMTKKFEQIIDVKNLKAIKGEIVIAFS